MIPELWKIAPLIGTGLSGLASYILRKRRFEPGVKIRVSDQDEEHGGETGTFSHMTDPTSWSNRTMVVVERAGPGWSVYFAIDPAHALTETT